MAVVRFASSIKNNVLTPIQTALDAGATGGTVKIYTGTIPTTPDTAVTTQTLLGELTLSKPCGTITNGVLTFGAVTQDSSANATGTATWARLSDGNGAAVMDIDISATGGSGAMQMNTTSIVATGPIIITAFSISVA